MTTRTMTTSIKWASLATAAAMIGSASAATSFTEDFSDNSAGPNMAVGTTTGTATFTGNFTATHATNRIYLGTDDADYSTVDFVFQALVTIPTGNDANASPFIGMGSPDANAANYGQPTTGSHVLMLARPDADRFERYDNGVKLANGPAFNENGGTHLIQMVWDSTTQIATFNWDLGNDGGGAFDVTSTIDGSDNGFNSTNSQLFIGGAAGLIFDDISVVAVPEPSSAALLGLGGLALILRRRK